MIKVIKVNDYVMIHSPEMPWASLDQRYQMNGYTPYKVIDIEGTNKNEIVLYNPLGPGTHKAYFSKDGIKKVITKEEYPEYFLWKT